jgi:preprotein translocase SecE subunit
MAGYKKDQGRMARMAAFWSLAALIFYGCLSLRAELAGRFSSSLGRPLIGSFPTIPVLGVQLTAAFLIVALLFAVSIWLLYRWVEKPRNADLLIETEAELRKVTWPTGKEVIGSSTVVILSVVFLMAFLAGADLLLARIARVIFGG